MHGPADATPTDMAYHAVQTCLSLPAMLAVVDRPTAWAIGSVAADHGQRTFTA